MTSHGTEDCADLVELWQTEWCPHSAKVRQRLTELGVAFVARQVPAAPADRHEMREATGTDRVPALVLEDGTTLNGDAEEILEVLDDRYADGPESARHHRKAEAHGHPGAAPRG